MWKNWPQSTLTTMHADELENDFNDLRKPILAPQQEKEDQEKSVTTLETVAAQKDEITTLQKAVASLEKTIATQRDEIASLKAENTLKKPIDVGQADTKAEAEALYARISVLEQRMQAWASTSKASLCLPTIIWRSAPRLYPLPLPPLPALRRLPARLFA
jgi:uncharacterized small protein (DUF1192 family)